jgi:RNA polymerase sigma factor (sigma-70 family)
VAVDPRSGTHEINQVETVAPMLESSSSQNTCTSQLEALLRDPGFLKTLDLVAKEIMRVSHVSRGVAHGLVLSAIGEPRTLAGIHDAWFSAKATGQGLGLAKVIIRRRVIDLLRKDARQSKHRSLPASVEAAETDTDLAFNELLQRSPRAQLEFQQIIQLVRSALVCFARQGQIQQRQADLLRRYALEEVQYSELGREMGCSESALRVRVHKAMRALRKHIRDCHSDLENLLDHDRRQGTQPHFA